MDDLFIGLSVLISIDGLLIRQALEQYSYAFLAADTLCEILQLLYQCIHNLNIKRLIPVVPINACWRFDYRLKIVAYLLMIENALCNMTHVLDVVNIWLIHGTWWHSRLLACVGG